MSEEKKGGARKGRRSRRRPQKNEGISPVKALKQPVAAPVAGPAELPLSPDEVRHLKATFAFLKDYRNALKLRVNAAEDLLLNGKREPTHRGVCQHLLAKVDKTRVLQASERLSAKEAVKLLAGVIRFAPELSFITRFLECVKEAAGQDQASAALTQALSRIDFDEASEAQVRKILELIVELFPEREQPVFVLSLLRGAAFRKAFDRSSDAFPESLAKMLVPLRAVHQLLSESGHRKRSSGRRPSRVDPELLKEGAALLIRVDQKSLLEFNEPVRKKLFFLLCELTHDEKDLPRGALLSLFKSLRFPDESKREQALLGFVGLLLRAGLEKDAKSLLRQEIAPPPAKKGKPAPPHRPSPVLSEFLSHLNQARIGDIAIVTASAQDPSEAKKRAPLPSGGRWYSGVSLPTQEKVRVLWGEASQAAEFHRFLSIWRRTLVPQLLLPRFFDDSQTSRYPYCAVPQLASSLIRQLEKASEKESMAYVLELCRLQNCLSALGLALPDGSLTRFAVDCAGRLWLADLSGVIEEASDTEKSSWFQQALLALEEESSHLSFEEDVLSALKDGASTLEVAQLSGALD